MHVYVQLFSTTHTCLTHTARDDGGVTRLTSTRSEDSGRGNHSCEIIGIRFATNQNHRLTLLGPLDCGGRIKHRMANGRTR